MLLDIGNFTIGSISVVIANDRSLSVDGILINFLFVGFASPDFYLNRLNLMVFRATFILLFRHIEKIGGEIYSNAI